MAETIRTRRYTIDRKNYLAAMWSRNLARPLAIIGIGCLLILGAFATQVGSAPLIGGVPVVLFYLVLIVGVRYFLTKRVVHGPDSWKIFDDPRTTEFSEEGISIKTEAGIEAKVPWTHFTFVERRGPLTLLFANKIIHYIFPDDAFAGEADRETLWRILKEKGLVRNGQK